MKYQDYYAALGLPRDADAEQIKKAYRKLARQFHPDVSKSPDAEARFKEIGEAYATLKDPAKRAAYDELGSRPAGQDFTPPPRWREAFDAGGAPFAEHGRGRGFEDLDLADLLEALSRGRQRAAHPARGHDIEAGVRISLEQAHRGATLTLQTDTPDGSRTLEVTVPPGVTAGQKLRLSGRGGPGRSGGHDGDLYLHIELTPHPLYRVDGHDLYFDLALAPWEAALGAEIEVATLDGPVLLTVPAGTRSGRKLRLRGRGLSVRNRDGRGDLYAVAHIDVPATIGARERELYEELARVSHFTPRAAATKEAHHEAAGT